MEVRPYLTAGAAIVTTGALVVATPAIVPSPTPPDVQVSAAAPRSVYADVALTQFTTQDLFNAIFSGFPDTKGRRGLWAWLCFPDTATFAPVTRSSTVGSSAWQGRFFPTTPWQLRSSTAGLSGWPPC